MKKPLVITPSNISKVVSDIRSNLSRNHTTTFLFTKKDFKRIAKAAGWDKKQIDRVLKK